MKHAKEIENGLKKSEELFNKKYKNKKLIVTLEDLKNGVEKVVIATEICTLKWVLGKGGALNALNKDAWKDAKAELVRELVTGMKKVKGMRTITEEGLKQRIEKFKSNAEKQCEKMKPKSMVYCFNKGGIEAFRVFNNELDKTYEKIKEILPVGYRYNDDILKALDNQPFEKGLNPKRKETGVIQMAKREKPLKCKKCINWDKIKDQEIPDCILTYSGDKQRKCYNFKALDSEEEKKPVEVKA